MPTSRPYHLTWLCEKVLELKPKSILDIGVGFGSKGMLFREYTDVWNGNMFDWKARIDGVEIFDNYIGMLQKGIYDNIYIGDITEIVDTVGSYDLIYMGDVIEHLTREIGEVLIKKLKRKCKNLIIVTPSIVSAQGSVYDNENETHLSQWVDSDFSGFEVLTIGNSLVAHYRKPELYFCEGMKFYGERALKLFGLNPYTGKSNGTVVFLGLYFDHDYEEFKKHIGKRIVFWNGSDVRRLLDKSLYREIINNYPAKHFCHNELLRSELETVGVDVTVQPLFFADVNNYKLSYHQNKELEVYINAHPGREDEYGVPVVFQIAKRTPDIKFFVYGVNGVNTENITYMGQLEEGDADERMSKHNVCLRLNRHDGLSQLVVKASLWGHHVISRLDIPNTIVASDVLDIVQKLEFLKKNNKPCVELREWMLSKDLNSQEWL